MCFIKPAVMTFPHTGAGETQVNTTEERRDSKHDINTAFYYVSVGTSWPNLTYNAMI